MPRQLNCTARILVAIITVALGIGFSGDVSDLYTVAEHGDLSDAQVEQAIQRGLGQENAYIGAYGKRVNLSLGRVRLDVHVYSDSDRIAEAAARATYSAYAQAGTDSQRRAELKRKVSFSVEEARAIARPFGVTVVDLIAAKQYGALSNSKAAQLQFKEEWGDDPPDPRIDPLQNRTGPVVQLMTDGKLVDPLTKAGVSALYTLEASNSGAPNVTVGDVFDRLLDLRSKFRYVCPSALGCASASRVFPVIQGAHEIRVVVVGRDGRRYEKKVDAKLFERD